MRWLEQVGAGEAMTEKEIETHVFYVVRNKMGLFYKTYTNSSTSSGWKKELSLARIYSKQAMARATVTRLANRFPKEPIPDIVEFHVTETRIVPQEERVAKSREEKAIKDRLHEEYVVRSRIEAAERQIARAQEELDLLKRR